MVISSVIYFGSAILVSMLGGYFFKRKSNTVQYTGIFLICLILALVAAFRGFAGTDSYHYMQIYNNTNTYFSRNDIEIGYKIIMYLCRFISPKYQFLFGMMGFLTSWFTLLTIKNNKQFINVPVSLFVFVLMFYYLSFNAMRQGLAMAIAFYAMDLFLNGTTTRSVLLITLAASIHTPALMCLVIILSRYIYRSKYYKFIVAISVATALLIIFNTDYILKIMYLTKNIPGLNVLSTFRYTKFLINKSEFSSHRLIVSVLRFLPVVFVSMMSFKNIKKENHLKVYYILMLMGYIISLMEVMGGASQLKRIGDYFSYFSIILLGIAANNRLKIGKFYLKKNTGKIIIYFIIIFLFSYIRIYRNYAELIPYGKGVLFK